VEESPKISEMITQILQYENTWRRKENTNPYSVVKRHMYLEFLYQIQIGEEIGVVDGRDNFADIINNEENFEDGTNSSQDSLPSSQDAEDLFNKKNIDTRSAKKTIFHQNLMAFFNAHFDIKDSQITRSFFILCIIMF
jgi:hypothetical protein